ncbi:MAG: tripartite tricarboxylate transporter substrate binding protein [Gammaproteobacteria bacterium]|nr:tripartite tricarboxylate transporter substrate binding protein [Gammaproteobacteria bacterium]
MIGIVRLALLAVALAIAAPASAQDAYPIRTVRLVVPFPAGSGTDVLSRLLADQLSRKWGRTVISENVPGASGNIGALDVWRSAPDGHTMMLAPPGPIATNRSLFKELNYDSTKWIPVSWLTTVPYVLTVRATFKGDLADLIALARAGKITAALPGPGGTAHLSAAHLQALAGVKMVYVPYKGLGPAMNDIVAGHVDVMFDTLTTSLPLHQQGRIRIIAVASPKRVAVLPDIPTVAESGYPTYRSITWFGLVAPPGTPTSLADRISRDVGEVIKSPVVIERLNTMQMEPVGSTPEEAAAFFADEARYWGRIIKDANIALQ